MKKIFALILVLVLALAVFSSCAKKEEEKKQAAVKYTIYNRTGEEITNFTIEDRDGTAKTTVARILDGTDTEISLTVVVDNTFTPNLQITYSTAGGNGLSVLLNQKADAITLRPETVDFTAPVE